ncbi:MAG: efflux RND transporter periplasmic adaptor subunit [Armatimonas sp.]
MSAPTISGKPISSARSRGAHRRFRPIPGIAVVVILAGAGLAWHTLHRAPDPYSKLLTTKVAVGDLTETVTATGSITSQTGAQVKIGSQITGRIKRLYADVGSTVKAGSIIAELDLPDIQAQLHEAKESLVVSQTKLAQQTSGVAMEQVQTWNAVRQAQAQVESARAKLTSAQAAGRQQGAQTPVDIQRARTELATAQAALSTAKSNLTQVNAGAALQIATAQEQINQAQVNAKNSSLNLKRQTALLAQGFVAASEVDTAQTVSSVNLSQVETTKKNLELVQQKVVADQATARNAVAQAVEGVKAAQAALDAARAEVNQNVVKQADVGDAQAQVRLAQAGLKTAQGNVAQDTLKQQDVEQAREAVSIAQQQVAYAQAQVDKTLIRSPISGTVLQLAAQQGETLAAGLSSPTLIVVADLKRLQVDAYVDETDIGKMRLGQSAHVTVDAFPKQTFTGHVAKIASGSTIQQGVVTYDVTVALDNTQGQLKPDMTANVSVQTSKHSQVVLVPAEAVKTTLHGTNVSVLTQNEGRNRVETRSVATGATDGVYTEIRSGLRAGETVVLAGLTQSGPRTGSGGSPFSPGGGMGGGRMR